MIQSNLISPVLHEKQDLLELACFLSRHNLINGEFCKSKTQITYPFEYAPSAKVLLELIDSKKEEVDEAIVAAKQAFFEWKRLTPQQRAQFLLSAVNDLQNAQEELANLLTLESGKALATESRPESAFFIKVLQYFAGLAGEIKGTTSPFLPNTLNMTLREPLGVVGCILPWNVPLVLMAYKIFPALICGNTVVIKPSEYATFSVLRACEILAKHLPKGTLNVIQGKGESTGAYLSSHPSLSKISFTGSVKTGRGIYQAAAKNIIPVSLELGGKSPMIVFPDVDLMQAVQGAINGMRFTRMGQSCCAMSRIYVHEDIFKSFTQTLYEKVAALKMGDPFCESTQIGSLVSKAQYEKVKSYIAEGKEASCEFVECLDLPKESFLSEGYYLKPTFFMNPSHNLRLMKEEIFGPVAGITSWSNSHDVLTLANDSTYGLSASIWTQNIHTAFHHIKELNAGYIQVNGIHGVQPNINFGGFNRSGLGKEATLEAMVEHYTRSKTALITL